MKKSFVSPSFLKQKARQIKKEKSISHHQALNEAARLFGYSNFRHYQNALDYTPKLSKREHFEKIFTENDFSKKFKLVISFIKNFETDFQDVLAILKQFNQSEEVILEVCEKLKLKNDIEAFLLSDLGADESKEIEMYAPYFTAKKVSLSNLIYTVHDDLLAVEGDYKMELEFDAEIPDSYKDYPHFNAKPMFGDFAINIDKNKNITIENSSIGFY